MNAHRSSKLQRRLFLKVLSTGIPVTFGRRLSSAATNGKPLVKIVEFDASGLRTGVVEVEKIEKPLDQWRKQLEPLQFEVARRAATERPGTGKYAYNHADGLYHCICCDTVLFDSRTKFESGTGWPSFFAAGCERECHGAGRQLTRYAKNRGSVRPLRCASGACI